MESYVIELREQIIAELSVLSADAGTRDTSRHVFVLDDSALLERHLTHAEERRQGGREEAVGMDASSLRRVVAVKIKEFRGQK